MSIDKDILEDFRYTVSGLRALVARTCHTPLLVAGQFVPLYGHEWQEGLRHKVATVDEMIAAIDDRISMFKMANAYLRGRVRELRDDDIQDEEENDHSD